MEAHLCATVIHGLKENLGLVKSEPENFEYYRTPQIPAHQATVPADRSSPQRRTTSPVSIMQATLADRSATSPLWPIQTTAFDSAPGNSRWYLEQTLTQSPTGIAQSEWLPRSPPVQPPQATRGSGRVRAKL
jgi:hypothetical protein